MATAFHLPLSSSVSSRFTPTTSKQPISNPLLMLPPAPPSPHASLNWVSQLQSKSLKFAFASTLALSFFLHGPGISEAKVGVNKPELLPKEFTPVIDVAGFLSDGQEKRLAEEIANIEKYTGFKLRVLAQNYPDTPGLAIKDYWQVDDRTIVFVADPTFGNILNFNVGASVDLDIPRSFWSRLAGKYGNMFYWKEQGEDTAIEAAVSAISSCLREPVDSNTGGSILPTEMELKAQTGEKTHCAPSMMARVKQGRARAIFVGNELKQAGKDDPRKYLHGVKVGIAITLVSMLYYFEPLYNGFGYNTVWAVMTVVVVFEFTVGGVLYKGVNRICATFVAGGLGIGFQQLTMLCGDTGRPIVLALVLFTFAACVTFLRFSPYLKARFDYGFSIFTLTFTMVGLTGFRGGELLSYARTRFITILMGAALVMVVSILIFPVWAGEDLHKTICKNLVKLANYFEGFPGEYFQVSEDEKEGGAKDSKDDKSFLTEYKSVLNSKASEENLTNFARWEPFHGRFKPWHPWTLYLEVGAQTRQVAYQIDALNCHLSEDNLKVPVEFKAQIEEPCKKICSESSKALKALSSSIKELSTNDPSSVNIHIKSANAAVEELKMTLKDISSASDRMDLLAIMPAASVASILIETVGKMDKVVESVEKLARKAKFRTNGKGKEKSEPSLSLLRSPVVTPLYKNEDFVVINLDKL